MRSRGWLTALLVSLPLTALAADPPGLRLPTGPRPTRVAAELSLTPGEERFTGHIEIDVVLPEATSRLWLNATGLTVTRAEVRSAGATDAAEPQDTPPDHLALGFPRALGPGAVTVVLDYSGPVSNASSSGLFRQKEGDDWYVFSDFEATDARRAFPCFDEPSLKAPWQLTLRVPETLVALSNAPVASEERLEGGRKLVRFRETPPLPTYLVALAVGPFDLVDAGTAGARKTPLRIAVPRGRAREAAWAAQATGPILERLEGYFGTPYPFEKLDQVAIPLTVTFAAMENPGLVTYGSRYLLARPGEDSVAHRRRYAEVCAHELAHQWFGDLVTMSWWDDLWLNESFATWMATRTIEEWQPGWGSWVEAVAVRGRTMTTDGLASARRIRQPIASPDDIVNAFDSVTYTKGGAVLAMFESWMGKDAFRRGVQRYLREHAWANATAQDFLGALAQEGNPAVAPAFSTFLEQAGVPVVDATLECGASGPTVRLAQRRWLPTQGSPEALWQVPVCVRFGRGDSASGACTLLTTRTGELALPGGGCPDWLAANARGAGYYRVRQPAAALRALVDGHRLDAAERSALISDVDAFTRSGDLPYADALALAAALAGDPDREVVTGSVRLVADAGAHLVPDRLRPRYERFIQKAWGARARALGLVPRPGEDEDAKLLRPVLVDLVAGRGADAALRAEGGRLARAWLRNRSAVDPDLVEVVLEIATRDGDAAFFDLILAELQASRNRQERSQLLRALGSFKDPALERKALDLIISGSLDPREVGGILMGTGRDPQAGAVAVAFLKERFAEVERSIAPEARVFLPYVGSSACDSAGRATVESLFAGPVASIPGGPRVLAQVLERIDLCIAERAAQAKSVEDFLRAH